MSEYTCQIDGSKLCSTEAVCIRSSFSVVLLHALKPSAPLRHHPANDQLSVAVSPIRRAMNRTNASYAEGKLTCAHPCDQINPMYEMFMSSACFLAL
jgi:hypothetical protein